MGFCGTSMCALFMVQTAMAVGPAAASARLPDVLHHLRCGADLSGHLYNQGRGRVSLVVPDQLLLPVVVRVFQMLACRVCVRLPSAQRCRMQAVELAAGSEPGMPMCAPSL